MNTRSDRPIRVEIFGRADDSTAFAMVNRHWLEHLAPADGLEVRCVQNRAELSGHADYVIWHSYEDDFEAFRPPAAGQLIAVRTWDFGPFPPSWVRKITDECDHLWVHTDWIRQQAVAAGVPPDRIAVIPHGVDPDVFTPRGERFPLPEDKTFFFLFAGASIRRKGFDLALRAFLAAFSPDEDACFVVKDRPNDIFYQGLDHDAEIRRQREHLANGGLVHIREHLSPAELAALYRSCDLSVYPYRAEGFGITILESMACGTPCLVPRFGACLDYCDDTNALFVQPKRIQLPVKKVMTYNTLGLAAEIDAVDFCEVPVDRLATAMREAYDAGRSALAPLSRNAASGVHQSFRWRDAVNRIMSELTRHAGSKPVRSVGNG